MSLMNSFYFCKPTEYIGRAKRDTLLLYNKVQIVECCIFTGRPARSAAMLVLFLLGPKMGFLPPQGRHVAPINVKFGTGELIIGPLPRSKFHVYQGRNVGIQPPKLKISNFGHNFSSQGQLVCTIWGLLVVRRL